MRILLPLIAAAALAACDPAPPMPSNQAGGNTVIDEECPRADGQPCR